MATIETGDIIELIRDVDAYLIPSGTAVQLSAAEQVVVTQALGGSYTLNVRGNLVRILSKDVDALGVTREECQQQTLFDGGEVTEDAVWSVLKTCYDPEIPVNIADLGLIYTVNINRAEQHGYRVAIEMTLTAPGCGMGPILVQEVHEKISQMDNVAAVHVELVFDPPWEQSMLSDAAKIQLGLV